jgi:hypothetical protein
VRGDGNEQLMRCCMPGICDLSGADQAMGTLLPADLDVVRPANAGARRGEWGSTRGAWTLQVRTRLVAAESAVDHG